MTNPKDHIHGSVEDSSHRPSGLTPERAKALAEEIVKYKWAIDQRLFAAVTTRGRLKVPALVVSFPIGATGKTVNMDFFHEVHPLSVFEALKAVALAYSWGYTQGQDDSVTNLTGKLSRMIKEDPRG